MGASVIPLMVDQPKFNTPVQNATAALNLKQLGNQVALGQQVQQENALKVQEQQRALDADKALAGALSTNTTKSPDGSLTIDHDGVGLSLTQAGFGKTALTYDAQRRADLKVAAEQLKAKLDAGAEAGKQAASIIGTIPALPTAPQQTATPVLGESTPAQAQPDPAALSAYSTAVKNAAVEAKNRNLIDDQHVAWLLQGANNPTPEFDAQLRQYGQMGLDHSTQMTDTRNKVNDAVENHLKEVQTGAAQAGIDEKQRAIDASMLATAAKVGPASYAKALGALSYDRAKPFADAGVTDPDSIRALGMQPSQAATAAHEAETATETARHNKQQEATEKTKASIENARLALEKQKAGFEMGGGVSPQAQMIADGKIDPQTARSIIRKAPGILAQIKIADPKFDQADMDKRYDTLKEFSNTSIGKAGGQALALNTLIHHADLYQDVGDALKNGSFTPGNAVYNRVATLFGSAPPQNAALVARFLAGETGKVATGGVPAEGEINSILKGLSTNASPDQIKQAGNTMLQIASGRAIPLMERVKAAKLDGKVQVLGPDAQAILQKRGFDPATMKPVTSQASKAYSQSDVDAAVKAHPGLTPAQADAAFKAKGWVKQ